MSAASLKEKLGAQLGAAPPKSLAAGSLFPDEGRWLDFLEKCARNPEAFFSGIGEELPWRDRPASTGGPGDWFPGGALSLADACLGAGAREAPCVLWRAADGGIRSLSRAQLERPVAAAAARLRGAGIGAGDRVGIVSGTGPELAIALLACFGAGATAVPIRERAPAEGIASRIAAASCRAVLVASGRAEVPAGGPPRIDVRLDEAPADAAPGFAAVPSMHPALALFDAAGQAFAIPAAGFAVQAIAAHRYLLDGRRDAPLWILSPPTHAATSAALVGALASGGVVGLADGAGADPGLLAGLPGRSALVDSGAAFALAAAADGRSPGAPAPHGSLELLIVEGTSVEPRTLASLRDRLFDRGIHAVQALSRPECGGFVAGPYPPVTGVRFSSVSRAAPGLALAVIDPAGKPCPTGVGGMLALSSIPPAVALELQGAQPPAAVEVKARLDRDGNIWPLGEAHVALAGAGGARIAEVEAALAAMPGIEQVAVVRYAGPGGRQLSRAFVKPAPGADLSFDGIRAALAAALGGSAVPESFSAVDELPYTRSGKLLRGVLRRVCAGEPLSDEELAMIKDPVVAEALARKLA